MCGLLGVFHLSIEFHTAGYIYLQAGGQVHRITAYHGSLKLPATSDLTRQLPAWKTNDQGRKDWSWPSCGGKLREEGWVRSGPWAEVEGGGAGHGQAMGGGRLAELKSTSSFGFCL